MRPEDDVKVLIKTWLAEALPTSLAVEFGIAANQLVKLWSIKYTFEGIVAGEKFCMLGLSNNPSHLVSPPAGTEIISDQAIYAFFCWYNVLTTTGGQTMHTVQLPLYGLVVPKRQILISNQNLATIPIRAEIYYTAISASPEDIGAVNLKQGKYRRK